MKRCTKDIAMINIDKIVELAIYGLVFIVPFSKAGIEIFGITAIVGWFLLKALRIKDKGLGLFGAWSSLVQRPLYMAVVIFLVVNLLSCITSVVIGHSIRAFFTKTLEYILFFIIIIDIFSCAKKMKTLLIVMFVSTVLFYINGMLQYFIGFDIVRKDAMAGGRICGSLLNANDFGTYAIVFIPLLAAFVFAKRLSMKYRIVMFAVFLMSLFCLIFTYSRGAWLGFLIGILFFGFVKSKKLFLCSIVILIIAFFVLPVRVKNRIEEIDSLEMVTEYYRIIKWKEAVSIVEDWPILGTGLNTYTLVAPKYKIHPEGGIYPHNSYLHMASEIGLVGLAAFFWFVYTLFKTGFRLLRRFRLRTITESVLAPTLLLGLMAGLLGFLVNAFFDTTLYALRLITTFWIMCGMLVGVINIVIKQSESNLSMEKKPDNLL